MPAARSTTCRSCASPARSALRGDDEQALPPSTSTARFLACPRERRHHAPRAGRDVPGQPGPVVDRRASRRRAPTSTCESPQKAARSSGGRSSPPWPARARRGRPAPGARCAPGARRPVAPACLTRARAACSASSGSPVCPAALELPGSGKPAMAPHLGHRVRHAQRRLGGSQLRSVGARAVTRLRPPRVVEIPPGPSLRFPRGCCCTVARPAVEPVETPSCSRASFAAAVRYRLTTGRGPETSRDGHCAPCRPTATRLRLRGRRATWWASALFDPG